MRTTLHAAVTILMASVLLMPVLGRRSPQADISKTGPRFEVASVRRAAGGGPPGDVAQNMDPAPGSFAMRNVPLRLALEFAYDLKRYQILGPSWIEVRGRGAPKLKPGDPAAAPTQVGSPTQVVFRNQPLSRLAFMLTARMDRPVLDMTGIQGVFDFTVETGGLGFNGQPPTDPTAGPSIFTAIQDDLGLRLESQRAPVDVIVVDQARRIPTEN